MYTALSVARYIIDYCNEIGRGISNLKLQKILYFVQAQFLVSISNNTPCFSDPIEAWDFGPLVPSVYHHYKVYGSAIIPSDKNDPLLPIYQRISESDKKLINYMIDQIADYSASTLMQVIHNQDPWGNAYVQGQNNTIANEDIRRFFKE